MCISTAYENSESGTVLAEHITAIAQRKGEVVLTDIMGKDIVIKGELASADLTRGVLIIEQP